MKIYHVTRRENLASILVNGLDPALAKSIRKSVWGVTRGQVTWALIHVLAKPWNADATLADLVVIEIDLPRSQVRRYQRSIWYTLPGSGAVAVTAEQVKDAAIFGRVGN